MAGRLDIIIEERKTKLNRLREMGINPYTPRAEKSVENEEVLSDFTEYEGKELTLAGRIMAIRDMGKLAFIKIQDQSGQIQLFLRPETVLPYEKGQQRIGYAELKLLDIGDFIEARGKVIRTKTGEISLEVLELKLLTKSVRPLPDQWSGLADKDEAFRKRYLDLVMDQEKIKRFERKAKFWAKMRAFLTEKGFIEVETPVLESVTGGADAKPFTTHMNAIDQDFFLRISTELFQKRLMGGGFEKVFTIGPNFRNEGMDDEHLPEYYQCEWYWAYADYRKNMELVRELYQYLAKEVYGKTKFTTRGYTFDLAEDWKELKYAEVIKERLDIDIFNDNEEKMLKVIKDNGVALYGEVNRQRLIDNCWKVIRKTIAGPVFLVDVPKFMSPLAKDKPEDPGITERFQPIIGGTEMGNGYSELNDPVDQRERFEEQQKARDMGDEEAQMMDYDYVEMLEYGMPPTSGFGFSERLFWFLENVSAREATLFPPMRVEKKK